MSIIYAPSNRRIKMFIEMNIKSVIFENDSCSGFVFFFDRFSKSRTAKDRFWKKLALPVIKCMNSDSALTTPGSYRKLALPLLNDIFFPMLLEFFRKRLCHVSSYFFSQENNRGIKYQKMAKLDGYEVARNHGITFTVAPDLALIEGIDAARNLLNRCWFDEVKCVSGIKALESYKKKWNDRYGCWGSKPLHNFASHGADAFRMLAASLNRLESKGLTAENWRALRNQYIKS